MSDEHERCICILKADLEDELDAVREEADIFRQILREYSMPGMDAASGLMMAVIFGCASLISLLVMHSRFAVGFAFAFALLGYPMGVLMMHWLEHHAQDRSEELSRRQLEIRQRIAALDELPEELS